MNSAVKSRIQAFGGFLTGMVLPNIGAFIAWGLLTALFMPNGYFPNETLDAMRPFMLRFMLPTLMAYSGGKAVYKSRGAVIGVVATFGVIAAAEVPMFIGAMVMGPLAALVLKKFDGLIDGKVKSGFEMLVNNFSLGIIGMLIAILGNLTFSPMILGLNEFFRIAVEALVDRNLLFAMPIFTEPARMLFLNNAISQGIMNPMGIQDAAEAGQSVFFLLTSNPGPGLGLLLAYWKFGKGNAKDNAPSAAIIHFFGGIHEMYFPYVLMKPVLIISTMVGWMCSNLFYNLTGAGLVAYPSPGSFISYMLMTPPGEHIKIIAGVAIGVVVSFAIASPILKADKKVYTEEDLAISTDKVQELKGKKKPAASQPVAEAATVSAAAPGIPMTEDVSLIVFACDAGMGSSAMGCSVLKKKVKNAGLDIEVIHSAIEEIPADRAQIIVCHESLKDRAKRIAPEAYFVTVSNFVNAPEYDKLVSDLSN